MAGERGWRENISRTIKVTVVRQHHNVGLEWLSQCPINFHYVYPDIPELPFAVTSTLAFMVLFVFLVVENSNQCVRFHLNFGDRGWYGFVQ